MFKSLGNVPHWDQLYTRVKLYKENEVETKENLNSQRNSHVAQATPRTFEETEEFWTKRYQLTLSHVWLPHVW